MAILINDPGTGRLRHATDNELADALGLNEPRPWWRRALSVADTALAALGFAILVTLALDYTGVI